MRLINRQSVIVKAKQPFADWVNSTKVNPSERDTTVESINSEPSVFLIPNFEEITDAEKYIEGLKTFIFEYTLNGWYNIESSWPKDRSSKVFNQWFECKYASMVQDVDCDSPLGYELWDE